MEVFPWGGSEELWFRTANDLLNRNNNVQVCVKQWNPIPSKIQNLKSNNAQIVYRKRNRIKTIAGFLLSKILKKAIEFNSNFIQHLRKYKPDIVLVSNGGIIDCFENDLIYNYLITVKTPVYIISQFSFENGRPLESEMKHRIHSLSEKWMKFYFVALRNKQTLQRLLGAEIEKSEIISNPLNIKNIGIAPWPTSEILKLACVARYDCAYKGQDILIETLALPELNEYDFQLNFFGAGPDKDHIISLIKYFKLEKKVFVHEHIADVDSIWESHHLLVLPSLAEGTPLVLQEGMLKGRAAMATDVGGNSTLVNESTGFLVSVASVNALQPVLKKVFESPLTDLQLLGKNAYEHAKANINLTPQLTIIDEILSNSK